MCEGLYSKYLVSKADGTPVDVDAVYFVLRLDTDPVARKAALTYAYLIRESDPVLARDLVALVLPDWMVEMRELLGDLLGEGGLYEELPGCE